MSDDSYIKSYPRNTLVSLDFSGSRFIDLFYIASEDNTYSYGTIISALISMRSFTYFHPHSVICTPENIKVRFKFDMGLPYRIYLFTPSEPDCKRSNVPVRDGDNIFPLYYVDL